MSRIAARFAELKKAEKSAFIPFITAGDPDLDTSFELLTKLPSAGADLIELGVPFSDPMADGPAIQASSSRALDAGMTLPRVLDMVRRFRRGDRATPIILMGSYNPIHRYGSARFARDAAEAGVDGLITVDLPPEEDEVLRLPAAAQDIDVIRLATPTTDDRRLTTVLSGASGFLYYVSIAGVTGTKSFEASEVRAAVGRLKARSRLPCVVGFGIRTPEHAAGIAGFADGAAVGTAVVTRLHEARAKGRQAAIVDVLAFCRVLADSVHAARRSVVE